MLTPSEADERVAKGVALLDARGASDWWDESSIDLASLQMSSLDHCVLGQLYGDYDHGTRWLGLTCSLQMSSEYGFDCGSSASDFQTLQHAWKRAINTRRELTVSH